MRILFICNYSLLYGANRSMLTILESLKVKGYDLLVYLPHGGPIEAELQKNDINYKVIRFFPSYLYIKLMYKHLLVPFLFFYNFLVFPKLIRETKKFNPDIIVSNTSAENIGIIISKFLKIKHISHIREFMSLDHGAYFVLGRHLKKKFINMSDGVVFVSKAVASYVLLDEPLDENKHKVIFNGVTSKKSDLERKQLGDTIKFGSVGVLQASKGHHLLVDYFNDFLKFNANAELHIFGEGYGSYEKALKAKIEKYGIGNKVILHGFVKDTGDIYNAIDVLCMFSRSEGFGRVTVEAMFNGVPVIGLNRGGTIELIKDGKTGFLVDDYISFEKAAGKLFFNEDYYNEIRLNAFNEAKETFSVERYVNNVEQFIEKISNNGK